MIFSYQIGSKLFHLLETFYIQKKRLQKINVTKILKFQNVQSS